MNESWGPWVECDGSGPPNILPGALFQVLMDLRWSHDLIRIPSPVNSATWPGYFWRWKRVRTGWFRTAMRRVCDEPGYAPIIRYRIREPKALAELRALVADPGVLSVVRGGVSA